MNFDDIQRRTRELFRVEAADLVVELETALLDLEQRPDDAPLIDRVFRAMHTLKGSGATSGFAELSAFLHHVEDVYNAAREGRLKITTSLVDLTLRIVDSVNRYLVAVPSAAPAVLVSASGTLAELQAMVGAKTDGPVPSATPGKASAPGVQTTGWLIRFAPHETIFQHGIDPGMFLDDLRALGAAKITATSDRVPAFEAIDPEACYLSWTIDLTTDATLATVRDVFSFVADECALEISPKLPASNAPAHHLHFQVTAKTLAAPGAVRDLWQQLEQLGKLRVLSGPSGDRSSVAGQWVVALETAADRSAIDDVFLFVSDAELRIDPATEDVAAVPHDAQEPLPAATSPAAVAAQPSAPRGAASDMLRVPAEKLDRLVNLVGELVILRSQVSAACSGLSEVPPVLRNAAEGLDRLSSEMRDLVLNVRMMPVGETLGKFRRLTRDVSQALGKEVDLVIVGEATEMDKSMLDQLNDPLVHLVRNSLDHGLEVPDERVAAGKSRRGQLRISAEQRGDRVCITVADDGRGLNGESIRRKAIAKGLIDPATILSESELHALIFLPGFSTAEIVSEVSGRGVGMDVVKKRIELMRGAIALRSQAGRGTEIELSLPLTLAIVDGLMVGVGHERYIVPLGLVREIIERPVAHDVNGRNMVPLRGAPVPFVRLRDVLSIHGREASAIERIVIVDLNGQALGLAVDEVLGSHQTVLKSLGWMGQRIKVFSGATITGEGRVALILDVPALVAHNAHHKTGGAGLEI
jgi:two-component system, chemotaxis family, sensor kinase CheA